LFDLNHVNTKSYGGILDWKEINVMCEMKYWSIIRHLEDCLDKYGDTAQGVDWPNEKDALIRYKIMLDVIRVRERITLLDFGCGTARLNDYILGHNYDNVSYCGLDISEKFIKIAREKFPKSTFYSMDILKDRENFFQLPNFDYIIFNGVFTEKIDLTCEEMLTYLKNVLLLMFKKTKQGMAFNVMSKAVDYEREDLFHLSTDELIKFITKSLSRHFLIRNDYGLYEYTTYLYKHVLII
jgi:SAM-dependent methyltransferase